MALTPEQLRLYERHLLLGEIGREGQERLAAARARLGDGADGDAARVASEYLRRAGVNVLREATDAHEVRVGGAEAIRALAGSPALVPAAAALAGAVAAVETLKALLGAGRSGGRLDDLVLDRGAK